MTSQLFDIILVALAIVILLHLFYNSSLFDPDPNPGCNNNREHFNDEDKENIITTGHYKTDDPIPKIERKGLDETDSNETPFYHIVNRLLNESEVNNEIKTKECGNKYVKLDGTNLKMTDKNYKILFGDNYTGRLTSDPYEAELKKVPDTFNMHAFEDNNMDEKYVNSNGEVCGVNEGAENMKRYIRDYVLDGRASCECAVDKSKSEFTRDEIDTYRKEHFEFRDKIYGTSAPAHDPVDKMNEIVTNGGMGKIGGNGERISDFYDGIVTCDNGNQRISNLNGPGFVHGPSVKTSKCVKAPILDMDGAVPSSYYMGRSGINRYYMKDNWMYDNENPNNGGEFFDGLQGHDPMMGTLNRTI